MVIAASFEDVKETNTRHRERENGGTVDSTNLFGGRSAPDIAHAKLSTHSPGWITSSHFHEIDQFQIIFGGRCKFGRHDVNPYCVHFSRAYTPYGPLVPNPESGFSFMVLRTRFDAGAQKMPDSADKLKQVPDRQPWQVTRRVSFPQLQHGADALLQEDPEIKDNHGLATYTLSMKPNARFTAPDPAASNGQYVIATKGSLRHDNKEYKAPAALFVSPQESAYEIAAGDEGLEALVLHFPRDYAAPAKVKAHSSGLKTWQCALCSFVYDEAAGLPHEGIAPGTRWQDVPDTWSCPDCAASKSDFQMEEL